MSSGEGDAHSAKDVRWFERAGSAGRTAGGTNTESVEHKQNRFPLDKFKADIAGIGQPAFGITIDHTVGTFRENTLFKLIAEGLDLFIFLVEIMHRQFTGFTQTNDAWDVFSACSSAAFLMAAEHKRSETSALADIQNADTFGGVQLVT